jgi:hypothetical protein
MVFAVAAALHDGRQPRNGERWRVGKKKIADLLVDVFAFEPIPASLAAK